MNCEIQSCIYSNYILTLCSVVHSLRFDLIFLMLDPQDEFYDRRLATHLVSLYHQTQEEEEEEFLVSKTRFFFYFSVVVFCTIWGISLGGGGGYFRNFWVGMCHWDPGTLNLYQS